MSRILVRTLLKFLMLASTTALVQAAPALEWQQMPAEKFRELPEVNAQIDFANYDRGLMAAAIFHETNRVRQQLHLRPFQHLPKLDEAADLQANISALLPNFSHENPMPDLRDASDRVRSVGLKGGQVGENIALTMALDGENKNASIGIRSEGVRRVFFDPQTGRELAPRTYAAFATEVVQQWMNSPHHRANIVCQNAEYLGCSARWRKDYSGVDLLYSVQVFFTPQTDR